MSFTPGPELAEIRARRARCEALVALTCLAASAALILAIVWS